MDLPHPQTHPVFFGGQHRKPCTLKSVQSWDGPGDGIESQDELGDEATNLAISFIGDCLDHER